MARVHTKVFDQSSLINCSRTLGSGSFAVVHFGQLRLESENEPVDVAIKISKESKTKIATLRAEIRIMGGLNHENVLKLIGLMYPTGRGELPWLLMEYMENGHLSSFMKDNSQYCDKTFKMRATKSVVSGMKYLNVEKGIVHGDLHALNILVGGYGESIKISDFGFSFKIKNERLTMSRPIGRFGRPRCDVITVNGAKWKPPEWIPGTNYRPIVTRPGDVWAFAVLVFEIWNDGRLPYNCLKDDETVCTMIARGYNPLHFDTCDAPPRILNIMRKCFIMAPVKRPTFKTILDVLNDNSLVPVCPPATPISAETTVGEKIYSESDSEWEDMDVLGSP